MERHLLTPQVMPLMNRLLRPLRLLSLTASVVLGTATTAHALCAFQEGCKTDADCGHGFECVHGQGSEEGVNAGDCGDDYCDQGETDADCPEDCEGYSHCKPANCEDGGDSECATEKGYFCSTSLGDDGEESQCLPPRFCCQTNADCPRHSFCSIVDDGSGGQAGASGEILGYCEVGDGTFETATVVGSSSSTTGSGGTSSTVSATTKATGGTGGTGTTRRSQAGGCSVGPDAEPGPPGTAALLLGALLSLRRRQTRVVTPSRSV